MNYSYINTAYLESVTCGDKDITSELVGIFREQAGDFFNRMLSLNDNRAYEELSQLAHKAKSSVAIIGMDEMAAMLSQLETDSREAQNTGSYARIIGVFGHDTAEAIRELDHYLSTLSGAASES